MRNILKPEKVKIISIVRHVFDCGNILGLGDDGKIYRFSTLYTQGGGSFGKEWYLVQ